MKRDREEAPPGALAAGRHRSRNNRTRHPFCRRLHDRAGRLDEADMKAGHRHLNVEQRQMATAPAAPAA